MSDIIPIEKIPNQTLSVTIDNVRYDLSIRDIGNSMCFDLAINDELILNGHRLLGESPLIPYDYLQNGNFVVITNDETPYYTKFGDSQFLYFMTQPELDNL